MPSSTPVVAFGNARTARLATLGLNPSRAEFPLHGQRLDGPNRRLASLHSLGVESLETAPAQTVETVLRECDGYFRFNPYQWFDRLEDVLRGVGATYHGERANACHLDLVQWATDPNWGLLDRRIRAQLLDEDLPFLLDQIRNSRIVLILVNGMGVLRVLERTGGCKFRSAGQNLRVGCVNSRIVEGEVAGVRTLGWSANLQSSHGVSNEFRTLLAGKIAALSGG